MALQYLLDPAFQVVNTAGKPATGGYLNVFIHGTREKYYCASDFNGTLHPFNIPLDSLGSNVVLADDSRAYDVYVYNRYGTQLYSRYNVKASAGGGISSTEIISSDGSITVTNTANGVDLSVTDNEPEIIVCSGSGYVTEDGPFSLFKDKGMGDSLHLVNGELYARPGWYNYEALVEISWSGPARNTVETVTVNCSGGMTQSVDLDLSTTQLETLNVSGTYRSHGEKFVCAVAGLPSGATARILKLSVFRINSIVTASGEPIEQVQSDWTQTDEDSPSYIQNKPEELVTSLESGIELVAGDNIALESTASGVVISSTASGEAAPLTCHEDTVFEITVTASDVSSGFFERLVHISDQSIVSSNKTFVMIYQCHIEANSVDTPDIPDNTPIKVDVYNYPNHHIDAMSGIYTGLGGASLPSCSLHGNVVLGNQMLASGRLFTVCFPRNTLTVGDKFVLTVRAVYIELTGDN